MSQTVKNPPAMWETWVQSLDWEDPLEEGMATRSSILAWRIPWTEETGAGYRPWRRRIQHDWPTKHSTVLLPTGWPLHKPRGCSQPLFPPLRNLGLWFRQNAVMLVEALWKMRKALYKCEGLLLIRRGIEESKTVSHLNSVSYFATCFSHFVFTATMWESRAVIIISIL